MTPREELVALRRLAELEAKAAGTSSSQPASAPVPATTAERALGSVPGRFALGAAETVVGGPLQLGANVGSYLNRNVAAPIYDALGMEDSARYAREPRYDVGAIANKAQSDIQEAKRKGMAAHGKSGFDVAGTLGSVAGGIGAVRNLALPSSLGGRVLQGAGAGAGFGLAAPVTEGDYGSTKATQVGVGTALGGLLPVGIGIGRATADKVRDVAAILSRNTNELGKLTGKYYRNLIGEGNVAAVVDALKRFRPDVAFQRPVAAQALRDVAEGSPIAAQTKITATQPGGASAAFGKRWQEQQSAIEGAKKTRAAVTTALRERALDSATNIDKTKLASDLARIAAHPEINTNSGVQSALTAVRKELENAVTARNIYGVRKTIDDMIAGRHGSDKNVAKQAIPRLIEMKHAIDDAIESGGGGAGWRQYLDVFSKRSAKIDSATDALKKPFVSPQRTSVQGGQRIAQEELPALPNPLIREVMVLNKLASMVKNRAEPAIDQVMARQLLDPKHLAKAIESADPAKRALLQSLLRYSRAAPAMTDQE